MQPHACHVPPTARCAPIAAHVPIAIKATLKTATDAPCLFVIVLTLFACPALRLSVSVAYKENTYLEECANKVVVYCAYPQQGLTILIVKLVIVVAPHTLTVR